MKNPFKGRKAKAAEAKAAEPTSLADAIRAGLPGAFITLLGAALADQGVTDWTLTNERYEELKGNDGKQRGIVISIADDDRSVRVVQVVDGQPV